MKLVKSLTFYRFSRGSLTPAAARTCFGITPTATKKTGAPSSGRRWQMTRTEAGKTVHLLQSLLVGHIKPLKAFTHKTYTLATTAQTQTLVPLSVNHVMLASLSLSSICCRRFAFRFNISSSQSRKAIRSIFFRRARVCTLTAGNRVSSFFFIFRQVSVVLACCSRSLPSRSKSIHTSTSRINPTLRSCTVTSP